MVASREEAVLNVDVGVHATEIFLTRCGEAIYSQSIRVGTASGDTLQLLEAVRLAQSRIPPELDGALAKGGIVLRSASPPEGFEALLRKETGLPVLVRSPI